MTQKQSITTENIRPLRITDTTLRDGHQCTIATRMRTSDLEALISDLDQCHFASLECWGGATFDVATRFLAEDPWERLRSFKKLAPHTPLQMLLRGQNLVGYRHYADDVVTEFCHQAAKNGIDIFRVFDALNDLRNLETSFKAIKETGKHIQGVVCYSVTEGRLGGPIFNIEYFVKKAEALRDMGADSICIKDMAGMIAPMDAYELVKAIKAKVKLPLQLHTHYTSGMASMSILKAAEAGVDLVDCCLAPLALRASQPAVEPTIVTFQGTDRDTGLELSRILKIGHKLEKMLPKYRDYLNTSTFSPIDTEVLLHQVPGGMISNLVSQLKEADALDKLEDVYKELPRARMDMGFPPLVTPTSQIIGVQAVNNVLFGRYKMITDQVKEYAAGMYGRPPVPMDEEFVKNCLKDYVRQEPITCRPGDVIASELGEAQETTKAIARDICDVLIYALYPVTGMRFLRWKYGLDPMPPETKGKTLEDIKLEDEMITSIKDGKLSVQGEKNTLPQMLGEPQVAPATRPARTGRGRSFNVFVEDEYFTVGVEPIEDDGNANLSIALPQERRSPARPVQPQGPAPIQSSATGQAIQSSIPVNSVQSAPQRAESITPSASETAIKAPMPGILVRYHVKEGDQVRKGDVVVILEAMKMENALPSPVAGRVKTLASRPGLKVTKDQILAIIA